MLGLVTSSNQSQVISRCTLTTHDLCIYTGLAGPSELQELWFEPPAKQLSSRQDPA